MSKSPKKSPVKQKAKYFATEDENKENEADFPTFGSGGVDFGFDAPKKATLSLTQAKDAVKKITAELKQPKLVAEVEKAKKAVKSMEDVMREIVPFLFEVQGHVMKQYGFVPDEDGFESWSRALAAFEQDKEFAALAGEMKRGMGALTTVDLPDDENEGKGESKAAGAGAGSAAGAADAEDEEYSDGEGDDDAEADEDGDVAFDFGGSGAGAGSKSS